jgi:hypothetical protein
LIAVRANCVREHGSAWEKEYGSALRKLLITRLASGKEKQCLADASDINGSLLN